MIANNWEKVLSILTIIRNGIFYLKGERSIYPKKGHPYSCPFKIFQTDMWTGSESNSLCVETCRQRFLGIPLSVVWRRVNE